MDYSRLTLVELRNELRKHQAKISGRKGELIIQSDAVFRQ